MSVYKGSSTDKWRVKSLISIVLPHRLMFLNHLHIIENSLFPSLCFSHVIKALYKCLNQTVGPKTVGKERNSGQWNMREGFGKAFAFLHKSWCQPFFFPFPPSSYSLLLSSLLEFWHADWSCNSLYVTMRKKPRKLRRHIPNMIEPLK